MTKEVPYRVKRQIEEAEIRTYPPIRLASVSGYTDNESFRFLFRYITGNNRRKRTIAMTAPVITAETIPMTAPVISDASTMSFAMPDEFTLDNLPEPLEKEVLFHEIPARDVAVIRFSGRPGKKSVEEKTARLLTILNARNIPVIGTPFLMRYNSPFTPWFLRRNEVGVEIPGDE